METKKNPRYSLKSRQPVFFRIGLIISLLLTIVAFEWRQPYDTEIIFTTPTETEFPEMFDIPPTRIPQPPPPPKKMVVVENDQPVEEVEETDIDFIEDMIIDEIPDIPDEPEEAPLPYTWYADQPASFPGGLAAFYKYVGANLHYPAKARILGIEGRVMLAFVIGPEGKVEEIQVLQGIGAGCDEEAIRVLQNAPRWNPPKQRGRPVKQRMVLPVIFKLQ